MSGARPEQAVLSRDTDMSKTDETRAVIEGMVDGLNDHRIADIGEFFQSRVQLDGQQRLWNQRRHQGIPRQLAKAVSSGLLRQDLR